MKSNPAKPDRLHVILSDEASIKVWTKHFDAPIESIVAAVEKVGTNAETVAKEIQNQSKK